MKLCPYITIYRMNTGLYQSIVKTLDSDLRIYNSANLQLFLYWSDCAQYTSLSTTRFRGLQR